MFGQFRRHICVFVSLLSICGIVACTSKAEKSYNEGMNAFENGKYAQAQIHYQDAIRSKPKNVKYLYASGWVHLATGKLEPAIHQFAKCIKYDEKYYGGYKGMANIFSLTGDFEKAEEFFQKALERSPKNSSIYNNMGDLYLRQNQLPKAKTSFQKAIELEPKKGDIYNGLISVDIQEQNYDEAIRLAQEALQKRYHQIEMKGYTYYLLALAHFELMKNQQDEKKKQELLAKSKEYLANASKLAPNKSDIQKLSSQIQEQQPAS